MLLRFCARISRNPHEVVRWHGDADDVNHSTTSATRSSPGARGTAASRRTRTGTSNPAKRRVKRGSTA
jgi:hypothetical protein